MIADPSSRLRSAALVASLALLASVLAAAEAVPERGSIRPIDPPESGFYAKRLDYDGIPIKAPREVADEALFEAWERLHRMMAKLPAMRANLRRAGAELHIIGKDQVTSDLPEHRHMKGKPFDGKLTVDERTRGLGGLLASCGEENLLRLEKDRYRGRDICIHEFAHNIFEHGVPGAIREKFRERRRLSLEKGLWVDSYAGSNVDEFFAELAMWYFGTRGDLHMKGRKPTDGRDGLRDYDPEALTLLEEFYEGRMEIPALEPRSRRGRPRRMRLPPPAYPSFFPSAPGAPAFPSFPSGAAAGAFFFSPAGASTRSWTFTQSTTNSSGSFAFLMSPAHSPISVVTFR
jgi:hypothetical protein